MAQDFDAKRWTYSSEDVEKARKARAEAYAKQKVQATELFQMYSYLQTDQEQRVFDATDVDSVDFSLPVKIASSSE